MAYFTNGGPNAIAPVPEDGTEGTIFENAVRRFGVENACEWFGQLPSYALVTIDVLKLRSDEANTK